MSTPPTLTARLSGYHTVFADGSVVVALDEDWPDVITTIHEEAPATAGRWTSNHHPTRIIGSLLGEVTARCVCGTTTTWSASAGDALDNLAIHVPANSEEIPA